MRFSLSVLAALAFTHTSAKTIDTNAVQIENAPEWVTESSVEQAVSRIQDKLEWDIRKVKAYWVESLAEFDRKHGFGTSVTAFSLKKENIIYLSPRITREKFEGTLGHELVHVILYQKYKNAIPLWIEEGLANFLAKNARADYSQLKGKKLPQYRSMGHPFKKLNQGFSSDTYYTVSLALTKMLAAKCDLLDLLQLSVGKNLETRIAKTCEISDIQKDFEKWVQSKA